jgi:hypothetical protein
MADLIQIRRDTATNWNTVNPVLAQGELGIETNTSKVKAGDGITVWTSLPYLIDVGDYITSSSVNTLTNKTISGSSNNITVDGDTGVGFRTLPQNSQNNAYTLILTDSGKHILHPSSDTAARTFTIPANSQVAFPVGTAITFINQNGAGVVTISVTTDTMRFAGTGTTGSRALAANGIATCIKISATEWIISGVGVT